MDMQLISQCGITSTCLSRSVPEVHHRDYSGSLLLAGSDNGCIIVVETDANGNIVLAETDRDSLILYETDIGSFILTETDRVLLKQTEVALYCHKQT